MNAVEFVKKHGIEAVKESVNSTTEEETAAFESTDLDPIVSKKGTTIGFNVKVHRIKYEDVKQIVDAFEFVNAHRSIEMAKKYISTMDADGTSTHYDKLRTFINLVEQCNA